MTTTRMATAAEPPAAPPGEAPAQTFGPAQEEAMVSLALDVPDFFMSIAHFLTPDLFTQPHIQYLMTHLLNMIEEDDTIPTREMYADVIRRDLSIDTPCFDDVIRILGRKSNHREIPLIKRELRSWARHKAYGLLYNDQAIDAYYRHDFGYLEDVFNKANRIAESGSRGFWFFDQIEDLFEENAVTHYKTGWSALDRIINDGGPGPGEVLCWMAATNVGKCLSTDTRIIEERLSRIYKLEMEDGSTFELRGSHEVATARGAVKVCNLSDSDELIEMPAGDDPWDLEL